MKKLTPAGCRSKYYNEIMTMLLIWCLPIKREALETHDKKRSFLNGWLLMEKQQCKIWISDTYGDIFIIKISFWPTFDRNRKFSDRPIHRKNLASKNPACQTPHYSEPYSNSGYRIIVLFFCRNYHREAVITFPHVIEHVYFASKILTNARQRTLMESTADN